ncbi:hypothetical protein CBL_03751 [Carabus blaptoides fortunei]
MEWKFDVMFLLQTGGWITEAVDVLFIYKIITQLSTGIAQTVAVGNLIQWDRAPEVNTEGEISTHTLLIWGKHNEGYIAAYKGNTEKQQNTNENVKYLSPMNDLENDEVGSTGLVMTGECGERGVRKSHLNFCESTVSLMSVLSQKSKQPDYTVGKQKEIFN